MSTAAPDLSVIVVSWNVREHVLRCLGALQERSEGLELQVVLVDNASTDGTVEAVRARFPAVRVLANDRNVGFPRANNQGLAEARGRHVLFLNPDTEVGPGTLARCVAELDAHPDVGLVGCRLEYPDGSVQYEGARRDYRLRHLLWEAFWLHRLLPRSPVFASQLMGDWDHRGVRDVEALMGAFMMARRVVVEEVDGLPENWFMYHEDLSFCLKVRRAGYRVRYLGDVVTVHHTGRSTARSPAELELLEGPVRVALIRERSGLFWGVLARILFGVRSLVRLAIAAAARLVPGLGRVRKRYPRVFALDRHWLHLVWTVAPWVVRGRMPGSRPEVDRGRPVLLLVGPTPPPVHGNSVYTEILLDSDRLAEAYDVLHLDTADRRSLENLGRLDVENVRLAAVHLVRLTGLLMRHRPDVVYVPVSQNPWGYLRDALFMVLARVAGARVVTHLHGGYFRQFYRDAGAPLRWLIRRTSALADEAWVLGDELRALYAGLVRRDRVRVVANGVPDAWADGGPPSPPEGSFRVLYLGGLTGTKGVFDLLEAVALLRRTVPFAELVLAGGWMHAEEEERARERIRELGLESAVELPGVVRGRDKRRALASAHVFAYPTFYPYEGQPLAILEAMAAGLPVVATARGAIADCVQDGATGRIVPERDPVALAGALAELAGSPEERARLGRAGRERYLESFTDEACVDRFVEALDEVVERRLPGRQSSRSRR